MGPSPGMPRVVARCCSGGLEVAGAGRHSWSVSQPAPAAGEVPASASSSSLRLPQHQPPTAHLGLKAPKFKRGWRGGRSLPAAPELPHPSPPAWAARAVLAQGALPHCRRARKLESCKGCAKSQPVPDQCCRQRLRHGERVGRGWGTGPPALGCSWLCCISPCHDSSFLPPYAELKPPLGLKKTDFPPFPLRQQ